MARVLSALAVATWLSLLTIAWEKELLAVKRAISLQQAQRDLLWERRARLSLSTHELAAPERLLQLSRQASPAIPSAGAP